MGRMGAEAMAQEGISLETAITWQLRSNHFPAVPLSMVPVCIEAIEDAREGDFDSILALPDPVTYRGSSEAPVWAILEGYHLEDWVNTEDQE